MNRFTFCRRATRLARISHGFQVAVGNLSRMKVTPSSKRALEALAAFGVERQTLPTMSTSVQSAIRFMERK